MPTEIKFRIGILAIIFLLSIKNTRRNIRVEFPEDILSKVSSPICIAKAILGFLIFGSTIINITPIIRGLSLGIVVGGILLTFLVNTLKLKIRKNDGFLIWADFALLGFVSEFFASFLFHYYMKSLI